MSSLLNRLRTSRAASLSAAGLVALAGILLVLLGVAKATVWAPERVTVARVAGQSGVPVVTTTAEATALLLDRVRQATAGADAARTPLEQGMRDLARAFTGVEQSADDFTKAIGTTLVDAFGAVMHEIGDGLAPRRIAAE